MDTGQTKSGQRRLDSADERWTAGTRRNIARPLAVIHPRGLSNESIEYLLCRCVLPFVTARPFSVQRKEKTEVVKSILGETDVSDLCKNLFIVMAENGALSKVRNGKPDF